MYRGRSPPRSRRVPVPAPQPEETGAYTAFIAALCRMAKEAKRVTATEKDVDSDDRYELVKRFGYEDFKERLS